MKKWSIFLTIFFFSIFVCTLKYVNMTRISNISCFRFCWKNEKLDWPKCARTPKHNALMALTKSQNYWLKWLTGDAVLCEFFLTILANLLVVSHNFICNKLYNFGSGQYVTNWLIGFSVKESKGLWGKNFCRSTEVCLNGQYSVPYFFLLWSMISSVQVRPTLLVKFAKSYNSEHPCK